MRYKGLVLALILIVFTTSCASNKVITINASEPIKSPIVFELNASSDNGKAGELKSIKFKFDSYGINVEARKILIQNAEFLKRHDNVFIRIEGHCDERGKNKANLELGEKRASFVRNQLVELGIRRERIDILSLGWNKPIMLGHDKVTWGKNRRANFVIIRS
jgi:peptidoglycan-associated lipoprotein